jgi:hypothetical protein
MVSAAADISSQKTQEGDQGVHTNYRRHGPKINVCTASVFEGSNFWGWLLRLPNS